MAIEVFNRFEKKYILDDDQYGRIIEYLSTHMESDKHNKAKDFYTICNLYYDTPSDELIRRSIEKPVYKEKLRLRSYGVPDDETDVFLEIKKKYKGIVNKRRTKIGLYEAYDFVDSGIQPNGEYNYNSQVLKELTYFLKVYDELSPKVYIAYDRKAFFGLDDKELRVTFDTNIRTRRSHLRLEYGDEGDRLLENGKWLMEIKTINTMPIWLSDYLNENEIYGVSFSKYGTEYKNSLEKKGI